MFAKYVFFFFFCDEWMAYVRFYDRFIIEKTRAFRSANERGENQFPAKKEGGSTKTVHVAF